MSTPYPSMAGLVGDTASAIRVIAEAVPADLVLPAGSVKVALLSATVTVPAPTTYPAWNQTMTGFTRVDGWLATVRSSSLTGSGGAFYNRSVYAKPNNPGSSPLPLSGSRLTVPYALSAGAGTDVPAATYTVDFLVWGVA